MLVSTSSISFKQLRFLSLVWLLFSFVAESKAADSLFVDTLASSVAEHVVLPDASSPRRLRLSQMTVASLPILSVGQVMKVQDAHFRTLRHTNIPRFDSRYDDYLQYSPAAVLLGLKFAGVEGRNDWGKMLVSDAFSVAIMAGVVNAVKSTSYVMRPDASSRNSFPSGHTATAFMTATMLSKEYGHLSPWVSVGAYAAATTTGLTRMANNRHWLSDVMTGAGIGILSVEVGYCLADILFKHKREPQKIQIYQFSAGNRPSFFGLYVGMNAPLTRYNSDKKTLFRTSPGSYVGLEGAYFFSPHWGIGGRLATANSFLMANREMVNNEPLNVHTLCVGNYFSWLLSPRVLVGTKLLAGVAVFPRLETKDLQIDKRMMACLGTGISCTFKTSRHYGLRLFCDYNYACFHRNSKDCHLVIPGAAFIVLF